MPEPQPRGAWAQFASDCANCAGLCCTALPFSRSRDFGADKPAGTPCANLDVGAGFGCRIHDRLRADGWAGCAVFECFGAGQLVTSGMFAGRTWADDDVDAAQVFAAFEALRAIHEVRYYCRVLADHPVDAQLRCAVEALNAEAARLASGSPDAVAGMGAALRDRAAPLLRAASAQLRQDRSPTNAGAVRRRTRRLAAGADLVGVDLRGADLSGLDLRATLLIGADLRGARMELTDVLGADLRAADVRGTDLREALFLTQPQANAARGDGATRLPPHLKTPRHWLGVDP